MDQASYRERDEEADPASSGLSVLRRLVTFEVVLVTIVLAITALLVNLAPARVEAGVSEPYITDVELAANNLNVLVDPNEVGENEVHLTVTGPSSAPARIKDMKVLFTMPSKSIGPIVAEGRRLAKGHFVVQGSQLSVPGDWTLQIVARTGRFNEEQSRVQLTVND